MIAIRRDDKIDDTHSIYVDQWDWEKVILKEGRTADYLKFTVKKIVKALAKTSLFLASGGFKAVNICEKVFFITVRSCLICTQKNRAKKENI